MLSSIMRRLGTRSRTKRARFLKSQIDIPIYASILDLGGGTGAHIAYVFPDYKNITVSDYSENDLKIASERYGYKTVLADGTVTLPFKDKEFDFVFCSSVIEHVTGPKDRVVAMTSTSQFIDGATRAQSAFAAEIARIAKAYYVQTPHRYFLIESHSWLPLPLGILPRQLLIPLLRFAARVLPKSTSPDWHLLVPRQMQILFPEAKIYVEKVAGWPKSIMAIRSQ